MRCWINLFEVRKSDGVWKNPSAKDLAILVQHRDMRGVAHGDDIWLDYADQDVHAGMRSRLGISLDSGDSTGDPADGFNFYVCAPHIPYEYEEGDRNDDLNGREDWIGLSGNPQFEVPGVAIFTNVEYNEALTNRAFARLVSKKLEEASMRVEDIINREIDLTGMEPIEINDGSCYLFAEKVVDALGGTTATTFAADTTDEHDLERVGQTYDPTAPSHCFVCHDGRVYDSEAPEGRDRWQELPYFARRRW